MPDESNTSPESSEGRPHLAPAAASAFELKPGTPVRRYIVLSALGRGGQGVVYAAFDPALDRRVALKLLGSGNASEAGREQLLREAQQLASLNHPNVVTVHDVDSFAGTVFIAMQYMPGGTLTAWAKSPRLRAQVLERFLEAGRGLAAVHALGRVHRDFKPDNVLLDEQGVARVSDFGLAREQQAATSRAGTSRYMAPEQKREGTVGPAADQYAFCVSLFSVLTGHFPEGRPGPLKFPNGDSTPPWLRKLLQRGLAERPEDRFPSMEALLLALAADPELAQRRLIRNVALVVAVAAGAAALGAWAFSESPSQRAERECIESAQRRQGELWSPARAQAVAARFTEVSKALGTQTFERVRARMEPEAQAWGREAALACRLEEPMARRLLTGCLQARAETLATTAELFASADRAVVESAVPMLGLEVLPVASCRLTATSAAPLSDTDADVQLRATLGRARVLRAAGRLEDAEAEAVEVARNAEVANAARVQAEALLLVGQLAAEAREGVADERLKEAILKAEAAGTDEPRARAWMALISVYAARGDFPAAWFAEQQAAAIVGRLGWPELLEVEFRSQQGKRLFAVGDHAAATAAFQRALELMKKDRAPDDAGLLRALNNWLRSLEPEQAIPGFQALVELRRKSLGATHPETALAQHNVAFFLLQAGRCEEAAQAAQAALAMRTEAGETDAQRLAMEHALLARALACQQRLPGGALLERAIAEQTLATSLLKGSKAHESQLVPELQFLLQLLETARRPRAERDALNEELAKLTAEP